MRAFKLMRQRKDGSLGPLFINTKQRVPVGVWLDAEDVPTRGYAHRPGWHALPSPCAPHLSERGRVWVEVSLQGCTKHVRPGAQGGTWYTAQRMKVLRVLVPTTQ